MGLLDKLGGMSGVGAGVQGLLGLGQIIGGAIGAAKGRKELKSLLAQTPQYKADEGLMGLYNQTLQRFGVPPTQSSLYKRQMQNIGRSAATGLRAAQQEGTALGAASGISRAMSDAALNAEIAAEQQKSQLLGQAMSAGQLAARERAKEFDINVMRPWDIRTQMAGQRAASGAQTFNIGAGNIFGAGSTLAQNALYRQIYGDKNQNQIDTDNLTSMNAPRLSRESFNRLLASRRPR